MPTLDEPHVDGHTWTPVDLQGVPVREVQKCPRQEHRDEDQVRPERTRVHGRSADQVENGPCQSGGYQALASMTALCFMAPSLRLASVRRVVRGSNSVPGNPLPS
jgi:hypothetical protein